MDDKQQQALKRIAQSDDYWALRQLFDDAENTLKNVLTVNHGGEEAIKTAARLIARQEAVAYLKQHIVAPIENTKSEKQKTGMRNTSFQ